MEKMLNVQTRRTFSRPRPRVILIVALALISAYFFIFSGPAPSWQVISYTHEEASSSGESSATDGGSSYFDGKDDHQDSWEIDIEDLRKWRDPEDKEDPDDVEPGYLEDGKEREEGSIAKLQHEKDLRKMWRYAYKTTANLPTSKLIYGNTLETIDYAENRTTENEERLREDPEATADYTEEKPVRFNPYPDYNSEKWHEDGHAPYVPCKGATGEIIEDALVFKGRPAKWPEPQFGTYDALGLDANICWERDTRLGPYGLLAQKKKVGGETELIDWSNVNWGDLQRRCVHKNAKRFDLNRSRKNPFLNAYPETAEPDQPKEPGDFISPNPDSTSHITRDDAELTSSGHKAEKRTAILLRSYTGMEYTENDKQVIRAMISELVLKSGGEYEVFLLVHVHDRDLRIFDEPETYQYVLQEHVPAEFHGMTVLWNDDVVWKIYTELKDDQERSVHTAQWLSVQKFSHDHPQFDFIWNWEMDFRYTGHHYDLLESISKFSQKQPRRGLWERNERWYIPSYHGDYDTDFRRDIEDRYGNETVWGPRTELPFINPVGPRPPTKNAEDDDYIWGVGEHADVVTLGPIFNPVDSNWIIGKHVWGFDNADHHATTLPRRTTIVTHSRVSKRVLDAMHVENLRGNHVASEMGPQTISLLHGFKAVYAPHPIFTDRDWNGDFLNRWFNPGDKGQCGGQGSPMGWGRERRYQGNTWYYRAEPPNRLYNNFMGWTDTGIGGKTWEEKNGRPCLPSVLLHQVKNTEETKKTHKTGFDLAYG